MEWHDWNGYTEAAAFTITEERERAIDFTIPYWEEPLALAILQPTPEKNTFSYARPFTRSVWLAFFLCILLAGPLLTIATRSHQYIQQLNPTASAETGLNKGSSGYASSGWALTDISNSWWYIYGATLQQGGIHIPTTAAGMFIVSTYWLYALIMVATYTGNFIAYLAIPPKLVSEINSLEDLAAQSKVVPCIFEGDGIMDMLQNGGYFVYDKLWEMISPQTQHEAAFIVESPEVFPRIRNGYCAFFAEETELRMAIEEEYDIQQTCEFVLASKVHGRVNYAFALQENSQYLQMINFGLLKLLESGLIHRWKSEYWPSTSVCLGAEPKDDSGGSLTLEDVHGVFYLLIAGLIISCVCMILEWVVYTFQTHSVRDRVVPKNIFRK